MPETSPVLQTAADREKALAQYAVGLFDDCPADWVWLQSIGWKMSTFNQFFLVPPENDTRLGFSKVGVLELSDSRERDYSHPFRIENPTRGQVRIALTLLASITP